MAKKSKVDISELMGDITKDISSENKVSFKGQVTDIINFVESKEYIGPIKLYPMQKLLLKVFYRGSIGNEDIELTDEEIELCKKHDLVDEDRGDVLGKYYSDNIFSELVLVWGRRSGKDFLASIMALYETHRLLEIEGGDPYEYYGIGAASPINVLTIANSNDQAKISFQEMKSKLMSSDYFSDKFLPEGIESKQMFLLTPKDKEENEKREERGLPPTKGSVVLEVGHSNSDSLLGKSVFVLILDEVASYKQTGGASSGERIYEALQPSTITYVREDYILDEDGNKIPELDEDGNPVMDEYGDQQYKTTKRYDGKIISISSPRGKDGILYDLYEGGEDHPRRLVCRLPTWVVNTRHSMESLRENSSNLTEEGFWMEYGAEFSGTAGSAFFSRDEVEKCFHGSYQLSEVGKVGNIYFAHLDPAKTSHNYGLVVLHKEMFLTEDNKKDFKVVVDHLKFWHPTPGNPIDLDEVDEYIINLKRRFYLGMITFDQRYSDSSAKKLAKAGIPAKMTSFTSNYKMSIYDNLYNLVNQGRIVIPAKGEAAQLLRQEMINLQRKWTARGYRVIPNSEAEFDTDDLVDALAGAAYTCLHKEVEKLPRSSVMAFDPHGGPNSARVWNSMSGPIGYGTGQQIDNQRNKIRSWPQR